MEAEEKMRPVDAVPSRFSAKSLTSAYMLQTRGEMMPVNMLITTCNTIIHQYPVLGTKKKAMLRTISAAKLSI